MAFGADEFGLEQAAKKLAAGTRLWITRLGAAGSRFSFTYVRTVFAAADMWGVTELQSGGSWSITA